MDAEREAGPGFWQSRTAYTHWRRHLTSPQVRCHKLSGAVCLTTQHTCIPASPISPALLAQLLLAPSLAFDTATESLALPSQTDPSGIRNIALRFVRQSAHIPSLHSRRDIHTALPTASARCSRIPNRHRQALGLGAVQRLRGHRNASFKALRPEAFGLSM